MTPAPHIDPAALAAARERLNARLERASKAADFVDASVADLRIVLDALREARRQAFEEAAKRAERLSEHDAETLALEDAAPHDKQIRVHRRVRVRRAIASEIRALAAKE